MILNPKISTHHFTTAYQPRVSSSAVDVGFIKLDDNDIIFSSYNGYSQQNILISDTASITSIVNTSISSNSKFTYNLVSVLLARHFIDKQILTGSSSSYISVFRSLTGSDLINDKTFQLGNSSIISIKKNKYGEAIRPLSFTASTSAGYSFVDSYSANETFGIIKEVGVDSASAGIILYDLGLVFIHGPNTQSVNSISALTSVDFYSTYKMNNINVFCTTDPSTLNYTKNESAFYNNTITSDPTNIQVYSTLSSTLTALNFEVGHVEFDSSASSCFDFEGSVDFTLESHVSASSLTSTQYIISHINSAGNAGYSIAYDRSVDAIRAFFRGGFSIDLYPSTNNEIIKQAISSNNYSTTGLVNITLTRRASLYTLYTGWVYYNNTNGLTSVSEYTTTAASNPATSFSLDDKIYIGSSGNTKTWLGMISNVKLYKFALKSEDITAHTINPSLTSFTNTTSGSNTLFTVNLPLNENVILSGVNNIITNTASATITGYAVSALTTNNNYISLSSHATGISGLSAYTNSYNWGIDATLTSGQSNYYLTGLYNRSPYITSVGLYNDNNILLAVAKLTQPIKKPKDIPFTIRINIDLQ